MMNRALFFNLSCLLFVVYVQSRAQEGGPHIKTNEDDMQAAETHLPFYGFSGSGSGGFGLGYGGRSLSGGGFGGRSFAGRSFGGIRNNVGYLGSAGSSLPFSHRAYGGGELDENVYGKEQKNLNDGKYEKIYGQEGDEASQGENGFSQGKIGLKSSKGVGGYFDDQQGGKKVTSDGKHYKGGQYFNDQGSAGSSLPFSHRAYGGGELDENVYGKEQKNLNDGKYEKIYGQEGDEASQGENGFSQGKIGLKSSKGVGGYFDDQQGGKKVTSDGKHYKGGQYFNDQGENADEKKKKSNRKKGHVIKGFKKSHHKDENEKTEEYYDEADDEGGSLNVRGQGKKYGENSESSFKGGHDEGRFAADQRKKQGGHDSAEFFKKDGGEEGKYGKKKYAGNDQLYASKSGNDLESLKGHHESSKVFKHYPHYYRR